MGEQIIYLSPEDELTNVRERLESTQARPAHSISIGTKGNIPTFAFNDIPCCVAGMTVQNQAAFSGGQDQRDYTFVQQSYIDGVVNAEKATLIQHAASALHAEFFQNEQIINPDICTSNVISDHVAGDKATRSLLPSRLPVRVKYLIGRQHSLWLQTCLLARL